MKKTYALLPLYAALTFLPGLSMAQEGPKDSLSKDDFYEMSLSELVNTSITTASKRAEKVSDAPATMQVITAEQIKARGYVYLKDALRDQPGMETIENYFSEMGTLVPVRGVVGNNKIIVLLNGIRLNPAGGEEMSLKSDFNIESAKQIEILYGPASTLYGQDAISAVINVITETPGDKPSLQLSLRSGSYSNKEGMVSYSGKLSGNLSLSSYLSYKDAGMSDLSKVHPAYWQLYKESAAAYGIASSPTRFDKGLNGFVKLASANSSISLFHREASRSSSEGGYSPILQFIPEAILKDRNTMVAMQNNSEFSSKVHLESSLSMSRYQMDPSSRYVTPLTESTLYMDDYKYALSQGVRLEEKLSVEATDKLNFTAGILAAYNDVIPKATIPGGANTRQDIGSQGGNIVYYTEIGNEASKVEMARVYNIKYSNYALYGEGRYQLLPSLKLVAGIRADKDSRLDIVPLSPRASLIYDLNKNFTAKYIYNRAFVAPAPYFAYNVYSIGIAILSANPDLQPERAQSHELNLSYRKGGLSLSSSLYYNQQSNLIALPDQQLPVNIVRDVVYLDLEGKEKRRLTRTANGGQSTAKGVDLSASYKARKASLWASLSYVDFSEVVGSHQMGLNGISAFNGRAGISYSGLKNLTITPSLIYRSRPENVLNVFGVSYESRAAAEVNLYMVYSPLKKIDFFVEGRNLLNQKIYLRGMAGPTPSEPVRANIGFTYHL